MHTGLIYDVASSITPTGTTEVCFNLPAFNDQATFSRLRVMHFESTGWENRTTTATFVTGTLCAQVAGLSPFAIVLFAPTAANASGGGRVTQPDGRGIARAQIFLTDAAGTIRYALTDFSGRYHFAEIEVGQTYTVAARHKRYQFVQPTQIVSVGEDLTNVDFAAIP